MIDLHIHTTYSDGKDTLEEVIEACKKLNLTQYSITDHNILDGSILAHEKDPLHALIGIELSVGLTSSELGFSNEELHLLGYFPNGSSTDFKYIDELNDLSTAYKRTALFAMIENLQEEGYDIELMDIKKYAKGSMNRTHICEVLIEKGYIKDVNEGMTNVVGENCKAYVKRDYVPFEDSCEAIRKDGGIPVLAHPFNYKPIKDIPGLLKHTVDFVDGIECMHYSATKEQQEYLINYAHEHNKLITGGSDYHGSKKKNVTLNMMEVPDNYMLK